MLSVTDPVGNVTTYLYDVLDRVVTETDPLNHSRTYEYDLLDNLLTATDRNGRVREFEYDVLNRLIEERWLDGQNTVETLTWEFDVGDRLLEASDGAFTYSFGYDLLNRNSLVVATGYPFGYRLDQTFDLEDRRGALFASTNGISEYFNNTYGYDALGRMTQATQWGIGTSEKRVNFTYNALDQFTGLTRYSDQAGTQLVGSTTYGYEQYSHRLATITHKDATEQVFAQYGYQYDDADRITQITSPDGTSNYTHDDTDQLLSADHSSQSDEGYSYDANGNRTTSGYQTGGANRLLTDGVYNYEYDNEGNRTKRTNIATGVVEEYTWDHRNRLVKVTEKESGNVVEKVEFQYDIFDRRVMKSIDVDGDGAGLAEATWFAYDGAHIVAEFDGSGSLKTRFLHGPVIDQVLAQENSATGDTLWVATDHLGTVRDVLDETGAVVNHVKYDSFGNVVTETNPNVNFGLGYTGREFEESIGLQYNRARWYDPRVGRWVSVDPIGFAAGDANLLRYVGNGPLSSTDPSGLFDEKKFWDIVRSMPRGEDAYRWFQENNGQFDRGWLWFPKSFARFDYETGRIPHFTALFLLSEEQAAEEFLRQVTENALTGFANEFHLWLVGDDPELFRQYYQGLLLQAMAEAAAAGGRFYVEGLAMANVGGTLVLTIEDIEEGRYLSAALRMLPLELYAGIKIVKKVKGVVKEVREVSVAEARAIANSESVAAKVGTSGKGSVWKMGPGPRGEEIERILGRNLPRNFDVFDKFENGVATSIKSVNLGDKTYQTAQGIRGLRKYVDAIEKFHRAERAGMVLEASDIRQRVLQIAIPRGPVSKEVAKALLELVEYGRLHGVKVIFKEID